MGGQTALNLAIEAEKIGLLRKYKIELIGANSKAISNAEDRKKFRKSMTDIGLNLPKSEIINNIKQAKKCLKKIGLPQSLGPLLHLAVSEAALQKVKNNFSRL
jgi:carbamoyl-phosphate synthase large subunit